MLSEALVTITCRKLNESASLLECCYSVTCIVHRPKRDDLFACNLKDSDPQMRDKIFISHANPEDNEFARWLTLRLITEGYPTWCDLVRLRGGEDFWKDIEQAIRTRTIKFIYVLSRVSNVKDGPLQELAVAKAVARKESLNDFILPVHIDNLSYDEMNIEIKRLNAISFEGGWAQGLAQLLRKLEDEGVPKDRLYTPQAASSWWRQQFSADKGVVNQGEDYLSSWFAIDKLPENIYFHLLKPARSSDAEQADVEPAYPLSDFGSGIFSFADRNDFHDSPREGWLIPDSHRFLTKDLLEGKHSRTFADIRQARNAITHLLDEGWRRMVKKRQLAIHSMANHKWCFYFVKDQVDKDKLNFTGVNGKPAHRSIMGYRTIGKPENGKLRHWHFGLSAKPFVYPELAYGIRAQVLFSYDGKEIWDSADRLNRARMNQTKNWWNDDWRDRILATMNWLASGNPEITIELGSEASIKVSTLPLLFASNVSYIEPGHGDSSEVPTDNQVEEEIDDEDLEDEES